MQGCGSVMSGPISASAIGSISHYDPPFESDNLGLAFRAMPDAFDTLRNRHAARAPESRGCGLNCFQHRLDCRKRTGELDRGECGGPR